MQVGLDKLTSANCKTGPQFGLDKQYWALVLTSSKYFQSAAARADGMLIPNLHKALTLAVMPYHFNQICIHTIWFGHYR